MHIIASTDHRNHIVFKLSWSIFFICQMGLAVMWKGSLIVAEKIHVTLQVPSCNILASFRLLFWLLGHNFTVSYGPTNLVNPVSHRRQLFSLKEALINYTKGSILCLVQSSTWHNVSVIARLQKKQYYTLDFTPNKLTKPGLCVWSFGLVEKHRTVINIRSWQVPSCMLGDLNHEWI